MSETAKVESSLACSPLPHLLEGSTSTAIEDVARGAEDGQGKCSKKGLVRTGGTTSL